MRDWSDQPESAGPVDERRAAGGGPALDYQALARSTVRLPQLNQQALERGEYVPVAGYNPYHDPDLHERENALLAARYDAGTEALRSLVVGAARSSGADQMTARKTAAEVVRQAHAAAPAGISEQALENIAGAVEKAVSAALAGTVPKPPRPHRRTKPLADAEPADPPKEPTS